MLIRYFVRLPPPRFIGLTDLISPAFERRAYRRVKEQLVFGNRKLFGRPKHLPRRPMKT